MRFRGSSQRVRLEGDGKASPSTYILPGLRPTFSQYPRLALRNLYPGVDAIFYGNGDHLEYDLMVAPHARLENIQLIFEGAEHLGLDKDGGLRIESGSGVLEQKLPRVFQADGREVSAHYRCCQAIVSASAWGRTMRPRTHYRSGIVLHALLRR